VSGGGGDSYLEEIENKNVKNLSLKKMCFYMKLAFPESAIPVRTN
jgi:hypothetical protein